MRVAIVEDDLKNAKLIQSYLSRFERECHVNVDSVIYGDGIDFIANYACQWDLILLDVEMPMLDGISTAKKVRELDSEVLIIFVTQLAQYAIDGYSVSALDYVLKPINYYAFYLKMQRVVHLLSTKNNEHILIRDKTSVRKIPLDSIRYIDVYSHTLYYHTAQGTFSSSGSKTLKNLEDELRKYGFCRCNQSYLVNLKHVKSFDKNTITIYNEGPLPVSRQMHKEFIQALMEYWEG